MLSSEHGGSGFAGNVLFAGDREHSMFMLPEKYSFSPVESMARSAASRPNFSRGSKLLVA